MDIIKEIPANLIPAELWKAFTLILIALIAFLFKKNLSEMREERKEFRDQILKLTVNDAVQDKQLEAHEGRLEKVEDKSQATIRYRK